MKKKKNIVLLFVLIVSLISLVYLLIRGNSFYGEFSTIKKDYGVYKTIDKTNSLNQKFVSYVDDLSAIKIQIGTYNKTISNKILILEVYEKDDLIAKSEVNTNNFNDNEFADFVLDDDIDDSYNKKYSYKLYCENCEEETFAIYGNTNVKNSLAHSGIIQVGNTYNLNYVMIATIVFVVVSLMLFNYNYKPCNKLMKIHKIIKSDFIFFGVYFLLSLALVIISYLFITRYYYYLSFGLGKYFMIIIITIILCVLAILKVKESKIKIEQLFALIFIPIGLFYWVFLLPNYIPDEHAHYATVYRISKGQIIYPREMTKMPKQVRENDKRQLNSYLKLNRLVNQKNSNKTVDFNTTSYNVINYLPGVMGLVISNNLGLNYFLGYYLARLLTFIFVLIVGYQIIKIAPFGKFVFFVYMLNPMYIHQAISLSADAIVNVICLFYISYILSLIHKEKDLNKKDKGFLFGLGICISLLKFAYFPILLLNLLLLKKNNKKNNRFIVTVVVTCIIICLGYYLYDALTPVNVPVNPAAGSGVVSQLKYIISVPVYLPRLVINTLKLNGAYYIHTFLGAYLGWLNIPINLVVIYIYMIMLILSPFLYKEGITKKRFEGFIFLVISLICFSLIFFGAYVSWNKVGDLIILGVQGRYFIPFLALPLLSLCDKKRFLEFKHIELVYSIMLLILHFSIIIAIIDFFI